MPLLALKRLKLYISKKYFYPFGVKTANNNAYILVISALLTSLISYSVVLQLLYPYKQPTTAFIDGQPWQFSPHVVIVPTTTATAGSDKYIAQQIYVATADQRTITKEQVKTASDIYETLTDSRTALGEDTLSLGDICATSFEAACVVHSPLTYWNLNNLDSDLLNYRSIVNKRILHDIDSSTHPYSTMGNVQIDDQGEFQKADFLILTFILKSNSVAVWNALWEHTKSELNLSESQIGADTLLLQFKWKLLPPISWRVALVLACAVGIFFYIRALFSQTNLLKSKSGLAISVLCLSFACFTTSTGLLSFAQYETTAPWPLQLLACTTSTLEHSLLLTNAVISRGKDIGRNERIGKGFQQVGVLMSSTLIGELVVLLIGSTMNDKNVRSFCIFSSVALAVAYILNLTLFAAILSIDIRRAELTDLGGEVDIKHAHHRHDRFDEKLRSKRAINVLVICFILLYLSVVKPSYTPPKQLATAIGNDTTYSQLSNIAGQFWRTINPSYDSTWLQVPPPHVVFTDKDNLLSIKKRLDDLQTTYNEKVAIVRSTSTSHDSLISFDFLSPLVLFLLQINIPGFMLSIILIGIIFWMIPAVREGYLLPLLRRIFVFVCLFLLRCISRITPLKTDSLIRKVENDYNEEGMHIGAISMQSQYNKTQNRNSVRNVKIRTLAGKHIPDLEFLDASLNKVVSTDQFGRIILWDIDKSDWMARLDHIRKVGDHRWLAETNTEYFDDDDDNDDYLDATCKQVPRAHCVNIDEDGRWVTAGFDDGTILLWDAKSTQLVAKLSIAKSDALNGKVEADDSQSRKNHRHDRVVKLKFLSNNRLLSVHKSGTICEWDVNKGAIVERVKTNHAREITNICVLTDESKCGHFIASLSKDGTIHCWKRYCDVTDKSYWKFMYIIQERVEITTLAAHQLHNGMGILVTGSVNNAVKVWDLNLGTLLCTLSNECNVKKKVFEEAEVGGPLLQFSKVAESSNNTNYPGSSTHILKQDMLISDHSDSICQVAVTRIGNPAFENDRCPDCHVVIDSGFFVASCSKDNTVHTWRLDRHTGKDIVGCTRCFRDYHRQQHYASNRTWKTDLPAPGTPITGLRYQKRLKKECAISGDESEHDNSSERLSLLPKFLGELDQVNGCGITFCENMVLAGARRRHSAVDENRWEAWFASLQYYDPPSLEEEASLIPVITFDLESDDNLIETDDIPMDPSSSIWGQLLLSIFGVKKVGKTNQRTSTQIEKKKKKRRETRVSEEDDEANEMLPFSTIKKVIPTVGGYGFCCDYGNFIKAVTFDGPTYYDKMNE